MVVTNLLRQIRILERDAPTTLVIRVLEQDAPTTLANLEGSNMFELSLFADLRFCLKRNGEISLPESGGGKTATPFKFFFEFRRFVYRFNFKRARQPVPLSACRRGWAQAISQLPKLEFLSAPHNPKPDLR